jgi:RNA polymerase sigma-70 factor (ECF subfamily)
VTDPGKTGHSVDVISASAAQRAHDIPNIEPSPPRFDEVYSANFDFVWRTVRRLGVAERSADDAVQDVFVVVHRRLSEFEGRSKIRTWLFAIARRVAHDHRRRARRKDHAGELPDAIADERAPTPHDAAETAEAVRTLHELLAKLPDEQREVFVMSELEQMTAPEIGEVLNANVNTIYSRLRLARTAFNKAVARRTARGQGENR